MQDSKISWTHHTFNLWRGCTKISPACQFCYAERLSQRNPAVLGEWGPDKARVIGNNQTYLNLPYKWQAQAVKEKQRKRVFCFSLADWLEDRPDLDRPLAFLINYIRQCWALDFLLLTKRPENFVRRLGAAYNAAPSDSSVRDFIWSWLNQGKTPPNVWVGVTAENDDYLVPRVQAMAKIPARVRFISGEPLLGPLNEITEVIQDIDWIITGGESVFGQPLKARKTDANLYRHLRKVALAYKKPFFFKQHGDWLHGVQKLGGYYQMANGEAWHHDQFAAQKYVDYDSAGESFWLPIGKANAGEALDGEIIQQVPTSEWEDILAQLRLTKIYNAS